MAGRNELAQTQQKPRLILRHQQVTSVSFSSCETYLQVLCSGNCTFVWDTRMMPLETGPECVERPPPVVKDMASNPSPA